MIYTHQNCGGMRARSSTLPALTDRVSLDMKSVIFGRCAGAAAVVGAALVLAGCSAGGGRSRAPYPNPYAPDPGGSEPPGDPGGSGIEPEENSDETPRDPESPAAHLGSAMMGGSGEQYFGTGR
jgi:hypothetical protein